MAGQQQPNYPAQPPPYSPQQGGYPPQQPGYPAQGYPTQQQPVYVTQPQQQPTVVTVQVNGNCPNCRAGFVHENFTVCGIIWAICCFPCGLICLMTMKEKKCGACGAIIS